MERPVFTEEELRQIGYALDYLHDADLSEYGQDNIVALESAMEKLNIKFDSKLD